MSGESAPIAEAKAGTEATIPVPVEEPSPAVEEPVDSSMELPPELAAIGTRKILSLEEDLPEPVKVVNKDQLPSTRTKKSDPSAGLPEDQEVLVFLSTEVNVETAPVKPPVSTKKSKVEDDDDFLSSLLQNI
jgi:hypothetical protein